MIKHQVERYFPGRWDIIGSFNTENEAHKFFMQTIGQHADWVLRRIAVFESHDGTSSSPALKEAQRL